MNLRSFAPCAALVALGFPSFSQAHAATTTVTGTFSGDDSVFSDPFTTTSTQLYTFTTTSAASGGFLPVLTLFNSTTGKPVDFSNSGFGDVFLSDTLASGSYVLDLTEFPNEAAGNLADGFLFAGDPTATGDACGGALSGKSFINAQTCSSATPLGNNYSLNITSAAVATTPEPSSFLLMLAPAAALMEVARRRRGNA